MYGWELQQKVIYDLDPNSNGNLQVYPSRVYYKLKSHSDSPYDLYNGLTSSIPCDLFRQSILELTKIQKQWLVQGYSL